MPELALRPVDPEADAELLHGWVTHPKSSFWLMGDHSVDQVRDFYRGAEAYVGLADDEPAFLVERYHPADDEIGSKYDVREGDMGMHFLCAPTDRPVRGFTRAVIGRVMELMFADPATRRVVVEPDVRNDAVHALNADVGFEPAERVRLEEKEALLSFCTRAGWERATRDATARDVAGHLEPGHWAEANRAMVAKALAEFAHERLLVPEPDGDGRWRVHSDDGQVDYRFAATRRALDHWDVDAASITRTRDGRELDLDAPALAVELRDTLGLEGEQAGLYVEELTSTLAAAAYKLATRPPAAAELVGATYQEIEAGMSEGHPCFVANSGRLGFGADDYLRYAPEAARPVRMLWVAGHRDHTTFSAGAGLDYERLLHDELGPETVARFRDRVDTPDDYVFFPVHPWQWTNRLAVTFAGDVATRRLVCLGHSDDRYLAQQSIRTFFNISEPSRHYVKTALSVVNMGFVRGLSAAYMEGTPAINDWLAGLIEDDDELDLEILRERASVGYRSEHYEEASTRRSPYPKMLAALWRESPAPRVGQGRRLATMASLLHTDRDGRSFAAELIARSALSPEEWLRRYLDAYLRPLLHCYRVHDLVFMPHGENLILVLEDDVPVRVLMKDIAEEVVIMDPDRELPADVERIRAEVPDELRPLSIFTDVFDCFFRFLSAILVRERVLSEEAFWGAVAQCVAEHGSDDLFAVRFGRSCLNRLQLRDSRQMVDLQDPAGSLQLVGELENPIARMPARP